MKATPAGDNLIRLTRFGAVNAYLVREQDGFSLVDTMISGSGRKLVDAALAAGAPVVRVLVTHAHSDHVGSLHELSLLLPDAELIASARDARLIHGDRSLDPSEPDSKVRGASEVTSVDFDRTVEDGDTVGSLEVVGAPGHTPGQIALLDLRDRSLIAADAYSTIGGVATTAAPFWRFPLPGFATWHRATALQSAQKLRDLEPSLLAAGHAPVVRDPVPAMDDAIARNS